MLTKLTNWSRLKSPWILHLNSGGCNACDIEVVAALTPRFDLERFGILLKATPRHADVIICTGPATRQMKDRLVRIYEQTPRPQVRHGRWSLRHVRLRSTAGPYNVLGGIDQLIPVDVYVPGCPVRPDAVIDGV